MEFRRVLFRSDNVSWRAGIDFKPVPGTLLYGTISKGYKPGSFGTINATTVSQLKGVLQESVLAYEMGFKTDLGVNGVDFSGAVFYYDYTNKQIRGRTIDPLGGFGAHERSEERRVGKECVSTCKTR